MALRAPSQAGPNADVTSNYVHCNVWEGGKEKRRGGMERIK